MRGGSLALNLSRLSVAMVALLSSTTAEATIERARVVVDSCPKAPFSSEELGRLLALELAPVQVDSSKTSTAVDLYLAITVLECGPEATEVEIAALPVKAGQGTAQRVRIVPRAPGNARVIALATAEMVRRLRASPVLEERAPPAPQVSVRTATIWVPVSVVTVPEPVAEEKPAQAITAYLGVEAYPAVSSSLGALALEATVFTSTTIPLRLELGLLGRAGTDRDRRGRITLGGGSAQVALLLPAKLSAVELALGPRFGAGYMLAVGTPASPEIAGDRVSGVIAELWLDLRISWAPSERWLVGGRASAGYIISGLIARADGSEVSGVDGAALAFSLSVGRVL